MSFTVAGARMRTPSSKVARSSGFEVRGFSGNVRSRCCILAPSRGSSGPFLSDRYFFVAVRLLKGRARLQDADFQLMALALNRTRSQHPFYLTAWVFLPDHWHAICAPVYPRTISLVMKSFKNSSTILINRRRAERGESWQARFFNRALRTV